MTGILDWLTGHSDTLTDWTPQRSAQAERDTLRREGIVAEPHYLWSKPAKAREQQAKARREQSWRKACPESAVIRQFGRGRA